jgi:hypothetical protein
MLVISVREACELMRRVSMLVKGFLLDGQDAATLPWGSVGGCEYAFGHVNETPCGGSIVRASEGVKDWGP